ncbi:MAG TPA: hypothetical protein VKZ53_06915 [Candidatus Angelobacter sp.]|nr:hypothetical protein [Candidatus Angelobacter sp.]
MERVRHLCACLILFFSGVLCCEAKNLAVVVNKNNATPNLAVADLSKIVKFENRKWPDGRDIVLVLLDPSSTEMQAVAKLFKIQPEVFKTLLGIHKASVVIVHSQQEMLRSVEATRGAIGLLDVYSISKEIRVVRVDGKLPLEQGYFFRAL